MSKTVIHGEILAAHEGGGREVLFYAGTPVMRYDKRDKPYYLSFSLDPAAVDMSRLNTGRAPFVLDHMEDVGHQIGVIETAWLADGARAMVRMSARPEFKGIVDDIDSRILSNVSMAAEVIERVKMPPMEDDIPHVMASMWRPLHISVVARGADHNAQFLSDRLDLSDLLERPADAGAASLVDRARFLLALAKHRFEAGL